MGTIFVDKIKNNVGGATVQVDEIVNISGDSDSGINLATNDTIKFNIAGAEKARMDSSGNVLIGHTSLDSPVADGGSGMTLKASGEIQAGLAGTVLKINRETSDGTILDIRRDGTTKGEIKTNSGEFTLRASAGLTLQQADTTERSIFFSSGSFKPYNADDNTLDLGTGVGRWDDVFATNGTIQTSDQNEKQDIASATTKELNVAKKLSALFKTFRWKDKVAEKGDKARTHTGIGAQEVQTAFKEEGLDASNYGLFTSDTWTDDDGKEKTRLGVRYPELFSFIFSSIEARLTALESK